MPTGVYKRKTKQSDEEIKAKQKEYRDKPENKAKRKGYRDKPEAKAKVKKYYSKPEVKARAKKLAQRPEVKAKKKEYDSKHENKAKAKKSKLKPENMAKAKEYQRSPEGIAYRKEWERKPENKAKRKGDRENSRMKLLQVLSKRLSNSDIPCCRCCGLNSHIAFLAVDHILGKKQMDSVKELTEIGYSSTLTQRPLQNWFMDNNYLSDLKTEYFQILCHSCNHAKGHSKDNKCPLEGKPH